MNPVVPNMKLKLTQGLLDSTSNTVTYVVKDSVININDSVKIDLTKPCFVRLTVYNSSGEAFLFSNPIIYKTAGTYFADTSANQLKVEYAEKCLYLKSLPNPFDSEIGIDISACRKGKLKVEIEDLNGKTVKTCYNKFLRENNLHIDTKTDDLHKGSYILKAEMNNEVVTEIIIKQ